MFWKDESGEWSRAWGFGGSATQRDVFCGKADDIKETVFLRFLSQSDHWSRVNQMESQAGRQAFKSGFVCNQKLYNSSLALANPEVQKQNSTRTEASSSTAQHGAAAGFSGAG